MLRSRMMWRKVRGAAPTLGVIALAILLASPLGCGIAHSAGQGAAVGTIGKLSEKMGDREGLELRAEGVMRRAAGGAVDALSQPEQLDAIQQIATALIAGSVSGASNAMLRPPGARLGAGELGTSVAPVEAIATQAVRALSRQVARELGPTGQGPLTASLSASTEQVSASMARGAQGELALLFPECRGVEASTCLDRAVERLSRASSAGVAAGIRESLGVWPMIFAFGVGAFFTIALVWAWRIYQARRPLPSS